MITAAISSFWDRAACQTADPELFFPVSGAGSAISELVRAKAICTACAVRQQCLDYALETGQAHGVWGGTTEDERRAMSASRRRTLARQTS